MQPSTPRTRFGAMLAAAALGIGLLVAPAIAQQTERDDDRGERRGWRGDRGDRGPRGRGWQPGRRGAWGGIGRLAGGFGDLLRPEFLRRDMQLFIRELGLDEDQSMILEALLVDYETEFAAASGEVREELSALRPGTPEDEAQREERRAVFTEMRELGREIRERRRSVAEGEQLDPAYLEEVRARFEQMRAKLEELRPEPPDEAEIEELRAEAERILRRWRTERATLRSEFLADVQVALTEAQLGRWVEFERTLRRLKSIDDGRLAGEEVDLFLVLDELNIGDAVMETLDETLTNYAIELDLALKARDDFIDQGRLDFMNFLLDRQFDAAIDYMNRESRLRVAVRDTNERNAELIAAALETAADAETAEAFRAAYRERAYERIFRPTRMQRAFEIARGLEDLHAEVLEAVLALEENYLLELGRINEELVQLTRKHEPQQIIERLRFRAERSRGNDQGPNRMRRPEDPIRETYGRRSELDDRYRTQLEALLTPEQIEQLPAERRGRGDWRGRRGGEGNERGDRFRQMRQRFDTNGDGELSEEERRAAREEMRRRMRGGGNDEDQDD